MISIAEGLYTALSPAGNSSLPNGAQPAMLASSPSQSSLTTTNAASSSTAASAPSALGDDGDGCVPDGGRKGNILTRRVGVEGLELRWDVNVHPWFPIPVVHRHPPGVALQ